MEVTEQNLETLRQCIHSTLSTDNTTRQAAEAFLQQYQGHLEFAFLLLHLINHLNSPTDKSVRQLAAVLFKNVIKNNWRNEDNFSTTQEARSAIKENMVTLICSSSPDVQKQLVEATSLIAATDFPSAWPMLLSELLSKIDMSNFLITRGVLLTLNAVLKKFRFAQQTDELLLELKYCLENLQEPLLLLYQQNSEVIKSLAGNAELLPIAMENHRLLTRIFYSLNWQDLPEYSEDHINEWMTLFHEYLSYTNHLLIDESEDTAAGPIESLRTAIIENLNIYVAKYEEEFAPFVEVFTQRIFGILMEVGPEPKYDVLAASAMRLIKTIAEKDGNRKLFNEVVLQNLVEHIVIRNISATDLDMENFTDSPSDYIRKDIEGSDMDTRRFSATELVRGLMKFFKTDVSQICIAYVNQLLATGASDSDGRAKDAAIHLVIAVSVMSTTARSGAIELNPNINIIDIFQSHILPEIMDTNVNARPLLKADALKMICIFRTQLSADFMSEWFPRIINYLQSSSAVVHTYAAYCIERYLSLKDQNADGQSELRYNAARLSVNLAPLFTGLFNILQTNDIPLNEYAMRCVMRCLITLDKEALPILDQLFEKFISVLKHVCKNPTNPHFNHYLFECIALIVRSACYYPQDSAAAVANCDKLEAMLFPAFNEIIQLQVVEFIVYNFQIMAELLSYRPANSGLSENFRSIFPSIVSPSFWANKGNIPALVDLLRAYLITGADELVASNQLVPVLGVFQKLLSVKSTEAQAFRLLNAVVSSVNFASITPYITEIFNLLLAQLQKCKANYQDGSKAYGEVKYAILCLISICHMISTYGAATVYQTMESITPGLVSMLATRVWGPTLKQIKDITVKEQRQIAVGLTRMCFETPAVSNETTFGALMSEIVTAVANSEGYIGDGIAIGEIDVIINFDVDFDSREFDSAYAKLSFAHIPELPSIENLAETRNLFASSLASLCNSSPGVYSSIIGRSLDSNLTGVLMKILSDSGVSIA